jgi:hypothetical protein
MEHTFNVFISMVCQRTINDYDTAKSIDNSLDNFLASEHPSSSKRSEFDANAGIYKTIMRIPADDISGVSQIWARYNNNIDNFGPFDDQPNFVVQIKGILEQ